MKKEITKAKIDALALEIIEEFKKEGEVTTFEEAIEMAKMELNEKANRRYEKSDTSRKEAKRERKVDPIKADLADRFIVAIENYGGTVAPLKTETEIHFELGEDNYTLKLIKHRPKK